MKKIHRCLTPQTHVIKSYKKRFEQLKKYNDVLEYCLPDEWRELCQFVNQDEATQVLTLSTTSQELLTRLRFMQANILKQCQKRSPKLFAPIPEIQSIFTPIIRSLSRTPKKKLTTAKSAEFCLIIADNCPPAVGKALRKLSKQLS